MISDFFITIWNGFVKVIKFIGSIPGKIVNFFKAIGRFFSNLFRSIKNFFVGVGNFFKRIFTPKKKASSFKRK